MNALVMSQARAMLVLLIGILVAGTVLAADQEKMSRSTAGFQSERAEDQRRDPVLMKDFVGAKKQAQAKSAAPGSQQQAAACCAFRIL